MAGWGSFSVSVLVDVGDTVVVGVAGFFFGDASVGAVTQPQHDGRQQCRGQGADEDPDPDVVFAQG